MAGSWATWVSYRGNQRQFLIGFRKNKSTLRWHLFERSWNHREPCLSTFGIFGDTMKWWVGGKAVNTNVKPPSAVWHHRPRPLMAIGWPPNCHLLSSNGYKYTINGNLDGQLKWDVSLAPGHYPAARGERDTTLLRSRLQAHMAAQATPSAYVFAISSQQILTGS